MRLSEAIEKADRMRPNGYDAQEKARWISELEGTLWEEALRWIPEREKPGLPYLADRDYDRELQADAEYADIYIKYLFAQIDFHNGDFTRYNASASMYQAAYDGYAAFLRRMHPPNRGEGFLNW